VEEIEIPPLPVSLNQTGTEFAGPSIGLSILPRNRNELPAAPESAILYKIDLFMAISLSTFFVFPPSSRGLGHVILQM